MKVLLTLQVVAMVVSFATIPPIFYLGARLRRLLRDLEPESFEGIGSPTTAFMPSGRPRAEQLYVRSGAFRASQYPSIRVTGEWLLFLQYIIAGGVCFVVLIGLVRIVRGS